MSSYQPSLDVWVQLLKAGAALSVVLKYLNSPAMPQLMRAKPKVKQLLVHFALVYILILSVNVTQTGSHSATAASMNYFLLLGNRLATQAKQQ